MNLYKQHEKDIVTTGVQFPLRIGDVSKLVYLNDIKKDGGTYWPQQRFTTKPRAGDLYIWPAGWTHSHMGVIANVLSSDFPDELLRKR